MRALNPGIEPSLSTTGPPSSDIIENFSMLKRHGNPFSFGTTVKLDEFNSQNGHVLLCSKLEHMGKHIPSQNRAVRQNREICYMSER